MRERQHCHLRSQASESEVEVADVVEAQIEIRAEVQTGAKAEGQMNARVEAQIEIRAEAQTGARAEGQMDVRAEIQTGSRIDGQTGTSAKGQIEILAAGSEHGPRSVVQGKRIAHAATPLSTTLHRALRCS